MNDLLFDEFADVAVCNRKAADLKKGAFRLDASFYSADNQAALESVQASDLKVDRLCSIAKVFCSGVRERTFVSPGRGYAMLTGSDLDTTTTADFRYVSPLFTRNYASERLERGDILISSAGTVGKCDFVWENHEGRIASQDIVRVRPDEAQIPPGYLYTILSSPLGNALLVSQSAGSVIVRIYTEHLDGLGIPRLPGPIESRISAKVIASFEARARSRVLLDEAQSKLLEANHLPPLPVQTDEEPDCFRIDDLFLQTGGNEFRLEAHFHNPIARAATAAINKCPSEARSIAALSLKVIMGGRFKRNYVESDHGTPFLSGKNIIQIRPAEIKHLSNSETDNLDELLVKRGWILVTCSGTIGRTCFVWHNFENYAASQHILRVLPNPSEADAGYLCSFLASDYGYHQVLRFRHGSVIDEITDNQLKKVIVPLPEPKKQREIGDVVRLAYEKRAEALKLEDEAQEILLREFAGSEAKKT